MHYDGTIIRPPSEADSILLEVTTGCSHNKCTFCGVFKNERFRIKPMDVIREDVHWAARNMPRARRMFLCGGDALVMPQARLLEILALVREVLPRVVRVGVYGNAKSIGMKSDAELAELAGAGLGIVYMGLESGDDATLAEVRKHGTSEAIVRAGRRVREAGMRLSVTVLLGLAGEERSLEHARSTGRALTAMAPDYVGALTLMPMPGTSLHEDWESGAFRLPGALGMLAELREMLAATDMDGGLFMANHASNYLPLKVRMPGGKAEALASIDKALAGERALKPEGFRGF
ncbi:radical SAM protein [Desulfocurvus sp. DL9XJH121]